MDGCRYDKRNSQRVIWTCCSFSADRLVKLSADLKIATKSILVTFGLFGMPLELRGSTTFDSLSSWPFEDVGFHLVQLLQVPLKRSEPHDTKVERFRWGLG